MAVPNFNVWRIYMWMIWLTCTFASGKFRKWVGPSNFVDGAPSIRDHHGFAECKGKLYVFGGEGVTGKCGQHS
jgi:hypothetical protein